jgi:hypothetical protein
MNIKEKINKLKLTQNKQWEFLRYYYCQDRYISPEEKRRKEVLANPNSTTLELLEVTSSLSDNKNFNNDLFKINVVLPSS